MTKSFSAKSVISVLGILVFLLIASPVPGKALESWDDISFTGIAYGNNTFVMTGWDSTNEVGCIFTSSDGNDWTAREKTPGLGIGEVAYKNNTFIATGWDGTIFISTDGVRWSKEKCGTPKDLRSVTYGNGTFVTVGEFCAVCTSTDGKNWEEQKSIITRALALMSFSLRDIAYGNNTFVAVGVMTKYPNHGVILTSLDGITWLPTLILPFYPIQGVVYGNNQFIVVGDENTVRSSLDGYNWTGIQITSNNKMRFRTIDYENNIFLVSGSDPINECSYIFISSDGENWSVASADCYAGIYAFAYGNGIFIGAGPGSYYYTSTDGYYWERHSLTWKE